MTREEAKEMFRKDLDAYGKPKKIMTKIDMIYNDFEKNTGNWEGVKASLVIQDKEFDNFVDLFIRELQKQGYQPPVR